MALSVMAAPASAAEQAPERIAYQAVINDYASAAKERDFMASIADHPYASSAFLYYLDDKTIDGYVITDIDGNGVEELVIGPCDGYAVQVYAFDGTAPQPVFADVSPDSQWKVLQDGTIIRHWTISDTSGGFAAYTMNEAGTGLLDSQPAYIYDMDPDSEEVQNGLTAPFSWEEYDQHSYLFKTGKDVFSDSVTPFPEV